MFNKQEPMIAVFCTPLAVLEVVLVVGGKIHNRKCISRDFCKVCYVYFISGLIYMSCKRANEIAGGGRV